MTNKLVDGGESEFFVDGAEKAATDAETEATIAKMVAAYRENLTPEQREEFDKDRAEFAEILNEYRKSREAVK